MIKQVAKAVMVMFALLLLLFINTLWAQEQNEEAPKHEFRFGLGPGIIYPLRVDEVGGPNFKNRFSWTVEAGVGYAHNLYKNLSGVVTLGVNVYSLKFVADGILNAPRLPAHVLAIRRNARFYCFYASMALSYRFTLAEKLFTIDAGLKFLETPSLFLGRGEAIQDVGGWPRYQYFEVDMTFYGEILNVYFLKLGMPLSKKNTGFSAHVVFNYCPTRLGDGTFYIANTTRDSHGTLDIRGSSVGVELRYSF